MDIFYETLLDMNHIKPSELLQYFESQPHYDYKLTILMEEIQEEEQNNVIPNGSRLETNCSRDNLLAFMSENIFVGPSEETIEKTTTKETKVEDVQSDEEDPAKKARFDAVDRSAEEEQLIVIDHRNRKIILNYRKLLVLFYQNYPYTKKSVTIFNFWLIYILTYIITDIKIRTLLIQSKKDHKNFKTEQFCHKISVEYLKKLLIQLEEKAKITGDIDYTAKHFINVIDPNIFNINQIVEYKKNYIATNFSAKEYRDYMLANTDKLLSDGNNDTALNNFRQIETETISTADKITDILMDLGCTKETAQNILPNLSLLANLQKEQNIIPTTLNITDILMDLGCTKKTAQNILPNLSLLANLQNEQNIENEFSATLNWDEYIKSYVHSQKKDNR